MSCCGGSCFAALAATASAATAMEDTTSLWFYSQCQMYPDMSHSEKTTTETLIVGVVPQKTDCEGSDVAVGAENHGCKCGPSCACDPCTCK
ncbi:metallothionein-like protein type 2 isoform X2 [Actinidia eriantha]|uniref:metallothionein-like protein type 2 isoform X2 n=1 Tax=Actinidia eriantha TaxID=165200 RepID=UPI00258EAD97|nr:metallothionein-like protein type 2 isoform X2 [Actinidia eriantha]